MRFRYLIEANGPGALDAYALTTITPTDDSGTSCGGGDTVAEAKALAQTWHRDIVLTWKDPPAEWQPDAVAVSQWLTSDEEALPV